LKLILVMRTWIVVALIAALAGCRGEPVPRDYQNAPPDVTNPPATKSETPAGGASGDAPPQPSTGNEGPNPALSTETSTTTMPDTPVTTTT